MDIVDEFLISTGGFDFTLGDVIKFANDNDLKLSEFILKLNSKYSWDISLG